MPDRIAEIRARREAIQHDGSTTPWTHDDPGECVRSPNGRPVAEMAMYDERDFIAHAPADVRHLLSELDAARERIALLRAEVTDLERIRRMYQEVKS